MDTNTNVAAAVAIPESAEDMLGQRIPTLQAIRALMQRYEELRQVALQIRSAAGQRYYTAEYSAAEDAAKQALAAARKAKRDRRKFSTALRLVREQRARAADESLTADERESATAYCRLVRAVLAGADITAWSTVTGRYSRWPSWDTVGHNLYLMADGRLGINHLVSYRARRRYTFAAADRECEATIAKDALGFSCCSVEADDPELARLVSLFDDKAPGWDAT